MLSIAALLLTACAWGAPPPASRRIVAGLDPVIELAAAAQLLASPDHPVARRFAPWKSHAAVALAAKTAARFPSVPRLAFLAQTPAPAALRAPSGIDPGRISGPGDLQGWLDALWDLAEASRFGEYFAAEQARLAPEIEKLQARLDAFDHTGLIEAYTGLKYKGSYRLILSPYCEPGAPSSAMADLDDGSYALFTVSGPKDAPDPDHRSFLADDLDGNLFHELAHGLLDTLSRLHLEELSRSEPLGKTMRLAHYGAGISWEQIVREHVVRAVKNRLILRRLGKAAAAKDLASEQADGFTLLPGFIERLDEYEADPRRYPNLARFYSRWLSLLDAEMERQGLTPAASPVKAPSAGSPGEARRERRLVDLLAEGGQPRWLKAQEALRRNAAALAAEEAARQAQEAEVARLRAAPPFQAPERQAPPPAAKEDPRRGAARRYQEQKDFRRARETLEGLLAEEPGRADLLADLGLCEHLDGDSQSALGRLRQAVAGDADYLPAYLTLGAVLTSLGRAADADAVYRDALARPERPGQESLRALLKGSRSPTPR